jgi:hypothetical protein
MKNLLYAAVAALALLPVSAKADFFQADSFSQPNGAQDVTLTLGSISKTVSAGEVDLHQNNPTLDVLVWCLDVKDTLFVPYLYTVNTYTAGQNVPNLPGLPSGGLNAGQARQIASLVLRGLSLGGPDAGQDDAAVQLAIWSVEYEFAGGISFSGLSSSLSTRLALELADSLPGQILDCPTCSIKIFSDDVSAPNQAMVTAVNAVPGPIVGAGFPGLIAGGLTLFGVYKRRKAKTA